MNIFDLVENLRGLFFDLCRELFYQLAQVQISQAQGLGLILEELG